jgi:cell wall-associated NlpC family hydrolase
VATGFRVAARVLPAATALAGSVLVGATGLAPTPALAVAATPAIPARPAAVAAISRKLRLNAWHYAMRQHGKPYIWGGTGPHGYDCSGLVYASFRSRGIKLPRTTTGMLDSWHLVRIRKSQAHRGDLAFFGTGHVELYDHGAWTYGAQHSGTDIGFHKMNSYWHPTMYFRVRRHR